MGGPVFPSRLPEGSWGYYTVNRYQNLNHDDRQIYLALEKAPSDVQWQTPHPPKDMSRRSGLDSDRTLFPFDWADVFAPSSKPYDGLPELEYPFHDRDILVTACGRICMARKKINISTVLAGQRLGIKEVDDGIWLLSFMRYDRKHSVKAAGQAA